MVSYENEWGGAQQRILVNAGSGPRSELPRLPLFKDWREIRIDVDPAVEPDIVADVTDLSPVADGFADAVWSSHCIEHLFLHQVSGAFLEFQRIMAEDGFMICLVPDVQTVAQMIASDQAHEPVYQSPAGPVTPHDMFYGFGPAIARGQTQMAHHCGFTPTILVNVLKELKFAEFGIRRLPTLELAVVARKTKGTSSNNCEALLQILAL